MVGGGGGAFGLGASVGVIRRFRLLAGKLVNPSDLVNTGLNTNYLVKIDPTQRLVPRAIHDQHGSGGTATVGIRTLQHASSLWHQRRILGAEASSDGGVGLL